jgi:hypothetical protein
MLLLCLLIHLASFSQRVLGSDDRQSFFPGGFSVAFLYVSGMLFRLLFHWFYIDYVYYDIIPFSVRACSAK